MSKIVQLAVVAIMGCSLMGNAMAHPGMMPHPETTNALWHWVAHALMALPVVAGAWLLVHNAKRWTAKRTQTLRQRG